MNLGYFQVFKNLYLICSSSFISYNIFLGFKLRGGGIKGGHIKSGSVQPFCFGFLNLVSGLGSGI